MPSIGFRALLLPLFAIACQASWAQDGLRLGPTTVDWPRWHARLGVSTHNPSALDYDSGSPVQGGAQVLGDYYFAGPGFGGGKVGGGFRATSGLLLGTPGGALTTPAAASRQGLSFTHSARSGGNTEDAAQAMPYIGVGYSGVALRGGWGFSADLGVLGIRGSGDGLALNRAAPASGQSLDDAWRDMRLTPVLQLGVSYSF